MTSKETDYSQFSLTFDDVLLRPGPSEVLPSEVSLHSRLTRRLTVNMPLLSAAMDTVTEAPMAIGMARLGGLGVLHRNLSPEQQAAEVDKVKRSEAGMIVDPITLPATATLAEAERLMSRFRISGVPITREDGKLIGILTNRDIRFVVPGEQPVSDYMTRDGLITAAVGTDIEEAKAILHRHRIEKLPLVDEDGCLKGLITVKDIMKRIDYPDAVSDDRGRLLSGAAIGVGKAGLERLRGLVDVGLDVAIVDTAHGHSSRVLATIEEAKRLFPMIEIIGGNVATAHGTRDLISAGADAVKIGIGAGSICTTRIISGAGVPQLSAVMECAQEARQHDVPCIADGGIKFSGDIVKALAAGADTVMLGSMLAGLEESPGEIILYEGKRYKIYRGMGSVGAMQGYGADRYGSGTPSDNEPMASKLVPEGVEGQVPYKGKLDDVIFQMLGGIRSGMGYVGAADLPELRARADFTRITSAAFYGSHPHGVLVTKEAPNYQVPRQGG